jgi:hypothetical protein
MMAPGPLARETFDRLEHSIVDPARAAGTNEPEHADDGARPVPGSPEPPD